MNMLRNPLLFLTSVLNGQDPALAAQWQQMIKEEQAKALTIAVVGPTGSGKSTFVNGITGAKFGISHTRPCTKLPQIFEYEMPIAGRSQTVRFCDLPGINESANADEEYLDWYHECFRDYDVIIYAVVAGTRSFEYDRITLRKVIESFESQEERRRVLRKVVVVLTKSDQIVIDEPWTLALTPDRKMLALPGTETQAVLQSQARYTWFSLLHGFRNDLVTAIPVPGLDQSFVQGPLSADGGLLEYQGLLDPDSLAELCSSHPKLSGELERLFNAQSAVACSTRFQYGLDEVLLRVFLSARSSALYRLAGISGTGLRFLDPQLAGSLSNVRLADPSRGGLVELSLGMLEAAGHNTKQRNPKKRS